MGSNQHPDKCFLDATLNLLFSHISAHFAWGGVARLHGIYSKTETS